jgi:esterase/lipase superfamily enzyme
VPLDIIAPWILEAWADFFARFIIDVPDLGLDRASGHAVLAAAGLLGAAVVWFALGHLPARARLSTRVLGVMAVLALPALVVMAEIDANGGIAAAFGVTGPVTVGDVSRDPTGGATVGDASAGPQGSVLPPNDARGSAEVSPQDTQAVTAVLAPPPLAVLPVPAPDVVPPAAPLVSEGVATKPAVVLRPSEIVVAAEEPKTVASVVERARSAVLPDPTRLRDAIPVFYGTDRARSEGTSGIDYTSRPAHRLEVGRALVVVPRRHQSDLAVRPWAQSLSTADAAEGSGGVDTARFALADIEVLSQDRLLEGVVIRLARSRQFQDRALVFVHGFNTGFDNAIFRAAQIAYDLGFDGAPFAYSWPSAGRVASYVADQDNARQSQVYLTEFLRFVLVATKAKSVSIIAHGLGSGPVLEALRNLAIEVPDRVAQCEIILAAPDLDQSRFVALTAPLMGATRGITLYADANDRALNISRRYAGAVPRAGDVPESGPFVIRGVMTVDATAPGVEALALNHAGYAERNGVVRDIGALLTTHGSPAERSAGVQMFETPAGPYWRLPAPNRAVGK